MNEPLARHHLSFGVSPMNCTIKAKQGVEASLKGSFVFICLMSHESLKDAYSSNVMIIILLIMFSFLKTTVTMLKLIQYIKKTLLDY